MLAPHSFHTSVTVENMPPTSCPYGCLLKIARIRITGADTNHRMGKSSTHQMSQNSP